MLDNIKSSHIFFVHLYTLKSLSELRIKQKIIVFYLIYVAAVGCVCVTSLRLWWFWRWWHCLFPINRSQLCACNKSEGWLSPELAAGGEQVHLFKFTNWHFAKNSFFWRSEPIWNWQLEVNKYTFSSSPIGSWGWKVHFHSKYSNWHRLQSSISPPFRYTWKGSFLLKKTCHYHSYLWPKRQQNSTVSGKKYRTK